jgi:alpha-beta hydrolase superfamily lysophospholipase
MALKQSMSFRSDSWKASRCRGDAGREHRLVAGEDVERHAGREVLAGRGDDEHARLARLAEAAHRVAEGREERRRHRVEPLGAVQAQVRDAAIVREFEEFAEAGAVVHGGRGGWVDNNNKQVETRDGLILRGREWPLASARGTIVLVHGLGEHVGRYAHVAAFWNERGWRVVGYDHRGHGASDGARGRLAAEDDLLADLARVVDAVRAEHREGPLVLLGHSLGGLVAARFVAGALAPAAAWARPVDALLLSSPALATTMSPLQKAMLAVLGPLTPNLAVGNGLKPEWISRDPAVVAAYKAIRGCTTGSRRAWRASSSTAASSCAASHRAGRCRHSCSTPAPTAACRPRAARRSPRGAEGARRGARMARACSTRS